MIQSTNKICRPKGIRTNWEEHAKGADGNESYRGLSGPVQVTFSEDMYGGSQQGDFVKSIQNFTGSAKYPDVNGGSPNCVAYTPNIRSMHGHVLFLN